jgi:hypothetical protein
LFRIHHVDLGDVANSAAPKAYGATLRNQFRIYRPLPAKERLPP